MGEYQERCNRVKVEMGLSGVDYLLVGPSSDLLYLIGYASRQSERLTLFVLPREEEPFLIIPHFELPRIEKIATFFDTIGWKETDNPIELLASIFPGRAVNKILAIGGQLYSNFLLGVQQEIPDAKYITGEQLMSSVRMRKSSYELEQIRIAGAAADQVFLTLLQMPLVGLTEKETLEIIHQLLIEKGHDSVAGGIVGAGSNGASPHHHASTYKLAMGEAVVIDYIGSLNGYKSDMTRTFHLGPPNSEFRRVYDIVNEANQLAFEAVRPGITAGYIDKVARDHITAAGYGPQFLHRTGHGIGLDAHEPPYIVANNETLLDIGMTFSIEPGIYLADKFGVRIEDIVVVTTEGAERLNLSTHELQIII